MKNKETLGLPEFLVYWGGTMMILGIFGLSFENALPISLILGIGLYGWQKEAENERRCYRQIS